MTKKTAADLPEVVQVKLVSEAIGMTIQAALDKGVKPDLALTALVSYATNSLLNTIAKRTD